MASKDPIADRFVGKRIGLLTNARWLTADFRSAKRWVLDTLGTGLLRLFSPEHGPWGEAGPGEHVADSRDPETNLPVLSLYGPRSSPDPAALASLEVLVIALPDCGGRAWTYLSTMLAAMRVAAEAGVEVLILDRPNPLGPAVEGPGVEAPTFVAPYDLPLRHGATVGALARLFAHEQGLPAPGTVQVPPPPVWVAPSPNLPTRASALAFSSNVLFEGTNLSEGRGTTRPFLMIGAPWIDPFALAEHVADGDHPGLQVRPTVFTPTSSKHAGEACGGIELFITEPGAYRGLSVALSILDFVRRAPEFAVTDALDRLWGGPGLSGWLGRPSAEPAELLADAERFAETYEHRIAAVRTHPGP